MALRCAWLLAIVASAGALEAPPGIVAMPAPESVQETWGGSAVVISADGTAITLAEALPGDPAAKGGEPKIGDHVTVVIEGGRRRSAEIIRRGAATTAVLLKIDAWPADIAPVPLGDSRALAIGSRAWTAGNACGAIEQDGASAISRGVVSGLYDIPTDAPPVRGRMGRVLSAYRGPVLEIDAGVNDGSQGGALLDARGRCIALVSLGQARDRRLGTAIPMHLIAADLQLPFEQSPPMTSPDVRAGDDAALGEKAAGAARSMALVYFERPEGLGNPENVPRPPRAVADAPLSERDRLQRWWDLYYNQQQVFYTDQPAPAIVVDAKAGLLITAAGNLHGGAKRGRVLLGADRSITCEVLAVNKPLDIALLKAASALPCEDAPFAPRPEVSDAVALVAPLRPGSDPRASFTMTRGVISATGRHLMQSVHTWLQIDARANYASLGGAAVDASGRIVGMAVLLAPQGEWLINSGVAMVLDAAAIAHALVPLKEGIGTAELPTLGMGVNLNPRPIDGRPRLEGVIAGTGAEAAGLKAGDVLQRVDGTPATSVAAVARALLKHRAGDKVTVEYERDGKPLSTDVELSEFRRDREKP